MAQNRIGFGHLISGIGALIALASLWLPWLSIDMTKLRQEPAFKAGLELGLGQQVAEDIDRFLALLPGTIEGNGWDVLERTDIAFAIGAAAVIALVYATVGLKADARATARTMFGIGMVGMFLVLVKLVFPGIPDDASTFVSRGPGPIVALIGWTICAVGGMFVVRDPAPPSAEPVVASYTPPSTAMAPVANVASEVLAAQPVAASADFLSPEPPAPLIPEYTPDPDRVAGSIGPPPRP